MAEGNWHSWRKCNELTLALDDLGDGAGIKSLTMDLFEYKDEYCI